MTNGSYQSTASEATAVGRVVAVNERGLKFEGCETWANVSKFAVGVVLPSRGDTVSVTFDRSGFIRSITPVEGTMQNGTAPKPGLAPNSVAMTRDRTITRLAVLKAAAEFAAGRADLKSGDVLKVADTWVSWVERADEPDDNLDEAF
jgi:hypothetical protein